MNKLFTFFIFAIFLNLAATAQEEDSLVLKDIERAKNLIALNVPGALELANSALVISQKRGFDRGIAEAYLVAGRCYIQTGDIEAQKAILFALKYAEKIQAKDLISDCYFYMGKSCFINGDTKSQLEWYNKAFEIRKTLSDEKRLADSYHGFGNIYLDLKQDSLAQSYFLLAREIRLKINDIQGLAAICNNLGLIADRRGDTIEYKKLLWEAIQMNEQSGNWRFLATNHGNLGTFYFRQKSYDSAWHHAYRSYEIRKNNDFKDHLSGTYTDLGDILFAEKKYVEALDYYKKGAALAESISGTEWLLKNYLALIKTYAILDSTDQKMKYTQLAEAIKQVKQVDTAITNKIPLPPAFDYVEAKSKSTWMWWPSAGAVVVICAAGFRKYKKKKDNSL